MLLFLDSLQTETVQNRKKDYIDIDPFKDYNGPSPPHLHPLNLPHNWNRFISFSPYSLTN